MTNMTGLLERNEQFTRTYTSAGLGLPTAQVVVVACLDHRVDPAIVLGLKLGEAPVIRNVGDIVEKLAGLALQLEADTIILGVPRRPNSDRHEQTFRDIAERLRQKTCKEVVLWDGPLPRTTSGKIVRSRVVMESAGRQSLSATRLRGHLPEAGS